MARYNIKPRQPAQPSRPRQRPGGDNDNKPQRPRPNPANDNNQQLLKDLADILEDIPEPQRKPLARSLLRKLGKASLYGYLFSKADDILDQRMMPIYYPEYPTDILPPGAYNIRRCAPGSGSRVNISVLVCAPGTYEKGRDMANPAGRESSGYFDFWRCSPVPSPLTGHNLWEPVVSYWLNGAAAAAHAQQLQNAGPAKMPATVPYVLPRPVQLPPGLPVINPNTGLPVPEWVANPAPNPNKAIRIDPKGNITPGPTHVRRPPSGRRQKEWKMLATGVAARMLARLINAATEGIELIDALHKALPERLQTKPTQGENRFGNPTYRGALTPQQKMRDLWNANDRMTPAEQDAFAGKAATNLFLNQIEDRFYGRIGKALGEGARRIGRPTGFQTGPAM